MVENILLITIDSLRADHFPDLETSDPPTFSTLVDEGTSFSHAFATGPGTTCSFPALLTGTLPASYGGLGPLSNDRPRVAAELHNAGLTTAAFHSNPFLSTHFNYDVGFDAFEDYQNPLMGVATELFPRGIEINNPKLQQIDDKLNITGLLKKTYQTLSGKSRPYVAADVITDDVVNWLENTDDQFFCWAHYMDVHHPCFPPENIRRQFGLENITASQVSKWYSKALEEPEALTDHQRTQFKQFYEAAIAYTDQQVGRIVDYLKTASRWEDTLVVLTSDHGELFGEYGAYGKPIRMYDELLRVPLVILNGPSYLDEIEESLMSLLDLPPLFCDVLDAEIPQEYEGYLPDSGAYRDFVVAEHQVEDGIVVGARSKHQLYEYNELREEQGFFEVAPSQFEAIPPEQGDKILETVVHDRLETASADVDIVDLKEDVEERLEDLGYL